VEVAGGRCVGTIDGDAPSVDQEVVFDRHLSEDSPGRRWWLAIGARNHFHHVRHLIEDALHLLHTRTDSPEKVLPFFVELVLVIAEEKIAETVDREDRRLQIVRQNGEEAQQLLRGGLRLLGLFLFQDLDGAPPDARNRSNLPAYGFRNTAMLPAPRIVV